MDVEIGKKPSALMPVVMSLGAIVLVGIQLATSGVDADLDEGALAHLWQLLIAAQLPVMAFFVYRWVRRAPRQALTILVVQMLALVTAALPVFLLGW